MATLAQANLLVHRTTRRLKRVGPLACSDILIVLFAYTSVYSVRTTQLSFVVEQKLFSAFVVFITVLSLYFFGGYHRIWSRTSGHEVIVIIKAVLMSTSLLIIADYFLQPRPLPLSVILIGNLLALMGFVAVRYQSRLISGLNWRWKAIWYQQFPEQETRVLIIGAGEAGQTTAWRLKHRFEGGRSGYQVIGFVDDDSANQGMFVEGSRVLGCRHDIPALVEKHNIDLLVFAIHNIGGSDFRDILSYCEQTKARIKIIPDVFAMLKETNNAPLLRDITPEDLLGRQTVSWHEDVEVDPVSNKVILVTGAAGSIGSELCRQLLSYAPVRLIMLDNNESGLHDLNTDLSTAHPTSPIKSMLVDITNRAALQHVFDQYRPQVVFHSAAYKHVPMLENFPEEALRVNVGGTLNLAEISKAAHVERFVLISTDKAVNPSSVMGASKRLCEMLLHHFAPGSQTLFTAVRFGNVLGSRGSVVPTFDRQIEIGGPVTITDQEMTRYFMTIPEAVNLVIHAACLTTGDTLFMLRMGEAVRIVELAERMIRLRGLRPHTDIPIVYTGIRPGEKLHEELHTGTEIAVPTKHPDIVRLVRNQNGFHSLVFFAQVQQLLKNGFEESADPLIQLRRLIGVEEHLPI